MRLNLNRPLVIFDLEATGLDLATARIIQFSYILVRPDGTEERANHFVNPERAIPAEVTQLTGITDEKVKDAPTFRELAPKLAETFAGCDFAGYNSNHYDIPLLCEEFLRNGVNFDFSQARLIDVCTIFKQMEKRNLAAAYKFYCGRKMEDDFQAHQADQDAEVTWRVLQAQLDHYAPGRQEEPERQLENSMEDLARVSTTRRNIDFAGRLVYNEQDEEVINFGKYKGRLAKDVLPYDPGYVSWVLQGDFTQDTKRWFQALRMKYAGR